MSVLNDYECKMHGTFESFERRCPYGCSRKFVTQVFLKAPGTRSDRTRGKDRELRNLANDYNLPDISTRDGNSTMTNLGRDGKQALWTGVQHASPGFAVRGEAPKTFSLKALTNDPTAGPGWKPGSLAMPAALVTGKRYQE